LDDDVTLLLK